jgi:predicted membrane protein
MMGSTATILWAVLFGAIGLGFFTYGKKQRKVVPFICGVALFVFPYFISNVYLLVIIGSCIVVLPYFVRL